MPLLNALAYGVGLYCGTASLLDTGMEKLKNMLNRFNLDPFAHKINAFVLQLFFELMATEIHAALPKTGYSFGASVLQGALLPVLFFSDVTINNLWNNRSLDENNHLNYKLLLTTGCVGLPASHFDVSMITTASVLCFFKNLYDLLHCASNPTLRSSKPKASSNASLKEISAKYSAINAKYFAIYDRKPSEKNNPQGVTKTSKKVSWKPDSELAIEQSTNQEDDWYQKLES